MHDSNTRPSVLILGGGFAGLSCASRLSSKRFDVCLVDQKSYFEFLPNIHEILSGVKTADDVRLGLDLQMSALGHNFVQGSIQDIATDTKEVNLHNGTVLEYDYLVIALGAVDAQYGVEGIDANAISFKTAQQCEAIFAQLNELERSSKTARASIIGAGITGIEALGEMLRKGKVLNTTITLVEARDRLLPQNSDSLDTYIRQLCGEYPVEFRCNETVKRIRKKSVLLSTGESIPSDLTIWTGGPAPSPLLAQAGLAEPSTWAPVDDFLHSTHADDIFIAGDSADLPSSQAKQAYHAIDMGEAVAHNLQALARGSKMMRYRPSPKPQLISFGGIGCIMVAGKLAAAAPALSAGKEVVFEVAMAQLDSQSAPEKVSQLIRRGKRASRKLLWPTVMSPSALLRQKDFELLGRGDR
ncbi:MAG: FAD-dependent oxidoreductase [Halioglobus sp.]